MSRVSAFQESITADLYPTRSVMDWDAVKSRLADLRPGIEALKTLNRRSTKRAIAKILADTPETLEALNHLFSIPSGLGFEDGREIPSSSAKLSVNWEDVAELYLEIGLPQLLTTPDCLTARIEQSIMAHLASRRRFRVQEAFEARVTNALGQAILSLDGIEISLHSRQPDGMPVGLRRRVDHFIRYRDTTVAALATTFQAQSGGRQQRDLAILYPYVQDQLKEFGIKLIVIADGRGVREASINTLQQLFEGVYACMSLKQAEGGLLAETLENLSLPSPQRVSIQYSALAPIITNYLDTAGIVAASSLPTDYSRSQLALGRYASEHQSLSLSMNSTADTLHWTRLELVKQISEQVKNFIPSQVVRIALELFGVDAHGFEESGAKSLCIAEFPSNTIIPERCIFIATSAPPSLDVMKDAAKLGLSRTPDSKLVCVLFPVAAPGQTDPIQLRALQRQLSANVILLSVEDLLTFAKRKATARSQFVDKILEQSDLTKASPFVLSSATPQKMYYGRDEEEALILSAVSSTSVALLGGRRIGKTSLMLSLINKLKDADFEPFYADCQTVATWEDFVKLANRKWKLHIDVNPFSPGELFNLLDLLANKSTRKSVVLLDEIDRLLLWDMKSKVDKVNEAFFRACRTLSQSGQLQFVFSGERTIATKLWDPHSPHWNFCQPLQLRQLTRRASSSLLMEPLGELQIQISDMEEFEDALWNCSNGHAQIIQYVGDRLMGLINSRTARARTIVSTADLISVTSGYEFAEHYLDTYWGQASKLERLLSVLICDGAASARDIRLRLGRVAPQVTSDGIQVAGRMLELYGIVDRSEDGYSLRASYFPEALRHFGSAEELINQYVKEMNA